MKINFSSLLLIFIASLFSLQCSQEEKVTDNYVVEAYIYSNEPIKNIKITETLPIESTDTIAPAIKDATVVLKRANKEYPLQFDEKSSAYFYPSNDLDVKPNDVFDITIKSKNRIATASTVVPLATKGLNLSDSKIHIPQIQINLYTREQVTALFASARLNVNWDNTDNQLHFISVESLDKFDPIFPSNFPPSVITLFRTFRFVSAPTRLNTYQIIGLSLETYGRYRVKVYRVNKEYADLFENQTQDSRDLNEPPSNITNAFGLFSAFASDSAFFEVVRN
jgi:Domain of unknown function (DUF4249)